MIFAKNSKIEMIVEIENIVSNIYPKVDRTLF